MNKNTKISLALTGAMIFSSLGGGFAYADGPTGIVTYNGQSIQVTNGQFSLNGVTGTIDAQGNYSVGGNAGNILTTAGVSDYQIQGQSTVVVTPTPVAAPVVVVVPKGPTGVVNYNGVAVQVTNGQFVIDGKKGTIDDKGNYVYDGQTGNILSTAGVSGYQITGQTAVAVNTSGVLTDAWLKANPGSTDGWLHNGGVNDAQVIAWVKQNPNLTAAQIVSAMEKYKIDLRQIMIATGKTSDEIFKLANDAGITKENLAQKGIISTMGLATTMNNVWWAVQAGSMNKGVWCALYVIDQGKVNPECRDYTQADMNTALNYQKNGYWGPGGSGDAYTELKKAGLMTGLSYSGPNTWLNGGSSTSTTPALVTSKGPTGIVKYNGVDVQVTNGQFVIDGKKGTIDDKGNYIYDGQIGNITTTTGVTGYQIQGQAAVNVVTNNQNHRTVAGKDRNGNYSHVDIDFLAQSMKDGTFDVNNFFINGYAQALKFTDAEIKEFQKFVATHSAKEVADRIATFSTENIIKIDEMRPTSSVGIAWRVDPWYLSRGLMQSPEAWQNVLEYAGVSFTKADLDKFYRMPQADLVKWLSTLTNDKIEKVQAYFYNGNTQDGKPYFASGWDDKSAYDPEIGRVVSPQEKDAIARIKFYVTYTYFIQPGGHDEFTTLGKTKRNKDGMWVVDAFKEYLTETAIRDYVANKNKGAFNGGTNGNITFKDGTTTTTTNATPVIPKPTTTTPVVPKSTTPVKPTQTTTPKSTTNTTLFNGATFSFTSNTKPTTIKTPVKVESTPTKSLGVIKSPVKAQNISTESTSFVATVTNPYKKSLSSASQKTLNTWISNRIIAKKDILSTENYDNFVEMTINKLTSSKKVIKNKSNLNVLNYIIYELEEIQNQNSSEDDSSFLDEIFK